MVNVAATSDGTERRVTMAYGANDRLVRLEAEGVGVVLVEYGEHGELTRVSSPEGRRVALEVTSVMQALLDLIRPASVKADVL
jgi:hypothetical protein